MIGSTLYLVGKEKSSGEYVANASSCAMCRRVIINAGIKNVIVRDTKDKYRNISVSDEWVIYNDVDEEMMGYGG
jgi:dCMP deaminase